MLAVFKSLIVENRRSLLLLGFFSLFCFMLFVYRVLYTGNYYYAFLNWNLLLGAIPWGASLLCSYSVKRSSLVFWSSFACWFFFFPNAPYILTDFLHLKKHSGTPLWFDVILLASYSWASMLFGIFSLLEIEKALRPYLSMRNFWLFMCTYLFVASFGVYIGRFLRWNSWDVLFNPGHIASQCVELFMHPYRHRLVWLLVLFFGLFLNFVYWSIRLGAEKAGELSRSKDS